MCHVFVFSLFPHHPQVRSSPWICAKELADTPLPLCTTQRCYGIAEAPWRNLNVKHAMCIAKIIILERKERTSWDWRDSFCIRNINLLALVGCYWMLLKIALQPWFKAVGCTISLIKMKESQPLPHLASLLLANCSEYLSVMETKQLSPASCNNGDHKEGAASLTAWISA